MWNEEHGPDRLYDKFYISQNSSGKKVTDFSFVLRPERDKAAVTALEAYADAVEYRAPNLASALREKMEQIRSQN